MHYELQQSLPIKPSGCLVVGIFSDTQSQVLSALDNKLAQLTIKLGQSLTETNRWAWQSEIDNRNFHLMVIQCGKKSEFTRAGLQRCLQEISSVILKQPHTELTLALPEVIDCSADIQAQQTLLDFENLSYQLLDFKTNNKKSYALNKVYVYLPSATPEAMQKAQAIARGVALTKRLSDMPANHCTPTDLANQANALADQFSSLSVKVLDKQAIQSLGMNALLAVAQGSAEPPVFIELCYQGSTQDSAPVVLVGKGVTFDSGGLTLKPGNVMDEMKYDMAGAASVLGTLHAVAALKLPINVVGLIPSTENMPSGLAVKPGDIVTSLSGQTIEILNTDAEGRLILADALTYAERFNPRYVIDIATLTGAIIVALGHEMTGLMTEDNELSDLLLAAGKKSLDRCWRMPLEQAYQDALDSPLADMINARFDRAAGSITAACFLSRFTKRYRWAHLDIAGTAWITGSKRKATGRPVPLLVEWLQQLSQHHES